MKVELPLGDVVDKITILLIKTVKISDASKLLNIRAELETLREAWAAAGHPALESLSDWAGLNEVNGQLWDVEDDLRDLERDKDFGPGFVELARSVYKINDRRASLKRSINVALGSRLVEEKSYAAY
jgi:hypothetical protein